VATPAAVVVDASRDPVLSGRFDDLVKSSAMTIEPVTAHQAELARHAYRSFGRGSGRAAGLYFGDCFAYALARSTGDQLLFKGDDFTFTDVIDALADRGY
jgi:ribonuclease VapC